MKQTAIYVLIVLALAPAMPAHAELASVCQEKLNETDAKGSYVYWSTSYLGTHSLRDKQKAKQAVRSLYLKYLLKRQQGFSDAECLSEIDELKALNHQSSSKMFTGSSSGVCLEYLQAECGLDLKRAFEGPQPLTKEQALSEKKELDEIFVTTDGVYFVLKQSEATQSKKIRGTQRNAQLEIKSDAFRMISRIMAAANGLGKKEQAEMAHLILSVSDMRRGTNLRDVLLAANYLEIGYILNEALDAYADQVFVKDLHNLANAADYEKYRREFLATIPESLQGLLIERHPLIGNPTLTIKSKLVAFGQNPEGNTLATVDQASSASSIVKLWNFKSGELLSKPFRNLEASGNVNTIALSRDGKWITLGLEDGSVGIWDALSSTMEIRMEHGGKVSTVAFSPGGLFLASGAEDKAAKIWSLKEGEVGKLVATVNNIGQIEFVGFDSTDKLLVVKNQSGNVNVIKIDSKRPPAAIADYGKHKAVAISPDGKTMATVALDGKRVMLWSLERIEPKNPLAKFVLRKGMGLQLAFSGDSRYLAVGTDKGWTLWKNEANENEVDEPIVSIGSAGIFKSVAAMSWTADSRFLGTAILENSTTQIWPMFPDAKKLDLASAQIIAYANDRNLESRKELTAHLQKVLPENGYAEYYAFGGNKKSTQMPLPKKH